MNDAEKQDRPVGASRCSSADMEDAVLGDRYRSTDAPFRSEVMLSMKAIFDLYDAIGDDVSIQDLEEVMKFAIADGWDSLEIVLSMVMVAFERAKKASEA